MPITYTNRKDVTYYLCQGVTKTGKPRYFFARAIKDKAVEQIPDGYSILESVNGIVSLSKTQASQLSEDEINGVKAAVARHPNSRKYRINVRPTRIEIYESMAPDVATILAGLAGVTSISAGTVSQLSADLERHAQFTPVLRFTLLNTEQRTFVAERMCYLGSIDDFIYIGSAPLEPMAPDAIATLGTEEFFSMV